MSKYRFSPTSLSLFKECPRCFWMDKVKKIKRPRGIFPSLPGGMDAVLKKYFDIYRKNGKLPPEIDNKVEGSLFSDMKKLDNWRNWRKCELQYIDDKNDACLTGALDDCIVKDGFYVPLDYKTRGWALKENPAKYYQLQLDCYCLMLESSGCKTCKKGYLVFYWPLAVTEDGIVKFHVEPILLSTDIGNAKDMVAKASNILNSDVPPVQGESCQYCAYLNISGRY